MDGIQRLLRSRRASIIRPMVGWCAILVSTHCIAQSNDGSHAEQHSSRRVTALRRLPGEEVSLNPFGGSTARPSQRLARRAIRVRPPAHVIDATKSPIVAVVARTNSESDSQPAANTSEYAAVAETDSPSSQIGQTPVPSASSPPTVEEALETRGSVTFRKTPISEVVFLLSDLWNINIVAGADVTGDVSGAFQNAPLSEVLSAALTASGYGYRKMGSSLVVLPISQLGPQGGGVTSGFADSGIAYFSPQFTEAESMSEPLRMALGPNVIVAVYPEENRIMIKGSPQDLRIASEAIQQLDVPRRQVRITAMIYDVSIGELERLGVTWNRQVRELANGTDEALAEVTRNVGEFFTASSELTTTGATSFGIRTISNSLDASAILEALDNTTESKLLADPSITVGDRTEASIRIVQRIPIVGANPVEGSNAVFTQTEFEEAGVILNVLPRISRDGTIQLQVQPEYSVVSDMTPAGPVIDTRTADTVVRVNNGQMFVLGGLRQKNIIESVRGVPYLRDIKFLGKLFRSHSTEVRESELIVFLQPEIITPYYQGHPREQLAGCVASDQLDRIPHAQRESLIPCCKDPLCPNHHPRCRANAGGFRGNIEMLGGSGLGSYEIAEPGSTQLIAPGYAPQVRDEPVLGEQSNSNQAIVSPTIIAEPSTPSLDWTNANDSLHLQPADVEPLHPPVHVDPQVPN